MTAKRPAEENSASDPGQQAQKTVLYLSDISYKIKRLQLKIQTFNYRKFTYEIIKYKETFYIKTFNEAESIITIVNIIRYDALVLSVHIQLTRQSACF